MRNYELALVLRPSLTEVQRKKVLETIKGWLKDSKVVKEEEWGQKPLTYPIKRETSGFYIYLNLETNDIPEDVEKRFTTNDNILRHLMLRTK